MIKLCMKPCPYSFFQTAVNICCAIANPYDNDATKELYTRVLNPTKKTICRRSFLPSLYDINLDLLMGMNDVTLLFTW